MADNNVDILVSVIDQATAPLKKISDSFELNMEKATAASAAVAASLVAATSAVVAYGVTSIQKFSEVGDAVEKASIRIGTIPENISAMRVAADGAGTSFETMEAAITKMQLGLVPAADGTNELSQTMKDLNVNTEDFFSGKYDPAEQFFILGNAIGAIADPTEQAQAALKVFGKSGKELLPLFSDGAVGLEDFEEKAKQLGVLFDQDMADAAAQLNDTLGELSLRFEGLAIQVGAKLAPYVEIAVDAFTKWFDSLGGLDGIIDKVTKTIEVLSPYIPIIAGALIGALVPALIAAAAAAWAFVSPLIPFIVIGAAIGAAIYLIIQGFNAFKELLPTIGAAWGVLWSFVVQKFTEAKDAIIGIFQAAGDGLKQTWEDIKAAIVFAVSFIVGIVIALFNVMGIDIVQVMTDTFNTLADIWNFISNLLISGVTALVEFWKTAWTTVSTFIKTQWENITGIFKNGQTSVTNTFKPWIDAIKKAWTDMWSSVSSAATTAWEGAKSIVKSGINWIIGRINDLINAINKIAKAGAGVLGISAPQIGTVPMLAKGGIITNTGSAIVGEAGPELVNLPAGASVKPLSGGMAGGITIVINDAQVWTDDDVVEKIGNPLIKVLKQHMAIT